MGTLSPPEQVKLVIAVMAQNETLMETGRQLLVEAFGALDAESEIYPFSFSTYYQNEMGASLFKQFVSVRNLIDPGAIADIKHTTNGMEQGIKRPDGQPGRGINLDPGYINGAQLVLATTKNYSHRIYLDRSIYGEITLMYSKGHFQTMPWTYPDYKTDMAFDFFISVRQLFLEQR